MAKNKTNETNINVTDFINTYVADEQKKTDSFELIQLMQKWSGFEAKMWGPTIVGFGSYHYKYASGHEGDAPLIAFSTRKAAFSLYVNSQHDQNKELLAQLGKYKIATACIYVKKLSDVDISILEKICRNSLENQEYSC